MPILPGWDGRSLLQPDGPCRAYLCYGHLFAIIDHAPGRTLKYLCNSATGKEEVYDQAADPHEEHNILATIDESKLRELRQAIQAFKPVDGETAMTAIRLTNRGAGGPSLMDGH